MEGQPLPPFSWPDQDGTTVSNDTLAGTPFLLYFYPKDDTPGCTTQACGIRDAWGDFEAAGLKVFGGSKDPSTKHEKFREKYDLPFPLLTAEPDDMEAFDVWKEKSMYGRTFMGISRDTFLVGADGNVIKHYKKVKPAEHTAMVLADFAAATASA